MKRKAKKEFGDSRHYLPLIFLSALVHGRGFGVEGV